MTDRYPVRATEESVKEQWKDRLFTNECFSLNEALLKDMDCRLKGVAFENGASSFSDAGILFPLVPSDEEIYFCRTYGGDAFRLTFLTEKEVNSDTLLPKWRFINALWLKLGGVNTEINTDVITKYIPQTFLEVRILKDLQKNDFYHAFCEIKKLIKEKHPLLPFFLYPFTPMLILSFYPEIHKMMPLFYAWLNKNTSKEFVQVFYNGRFCGFVEKKEKELILKEALSLRRLQGKIPSRMVFDKERILNVWD